MPRRRGNRTAGAAVLSVLLVAAAGGGVALKSPLFDLRDVRVVGAQRVAPEEIAELSGVVEGTNLLLLGMDEIGAAIRSNPWVADVVVRRELPSTLVVSVEERTPVGWVAGPAGGAIVAEDGTVLAQRARRSGLALLGRVGSVPEPGTRFADHDGAVRVAASLTPRLRREVAAIATREGRIVLRLRSGGRVLYGRPVALGAKRSGLESLLAWVQEEGVDVEYLDLRAPGTPAIRPAAEPRPADAG